MLKMEATESLNNQTTTKKPLKCLEMNETCTSNACKKIIECTKPDYNSHCVTMSQHNEFGPPNIIYAGCWTGGDECNSPVELLDHIEHKISNEVHHDKFYIERLKNYNLSEQLIDPNIQDKCIGYSKDPVDQSYLARKNQTLCCCKGMECNRENNLAYVDERNPFEVFAVKMNPRIPKTTPFSNQNSNDGGIDWFISARDLTMVCLSGFVCLIIISVIAGLFFCLKRNNKKRKNSPYFSSVYYSRANSLNDMANSNLGHELTHIQNTCSFNSNNLDQGHITLSDEGNFPLPMNNHLINNENQLTAAPNVQILPNNDAVYHKKIIKKNKQILIQSEINNEKDNQSDSQSVDNFLPSRIKCSDIKLIERIAQGQFSSVWRSRCHSLDDGESVYKNAVPEYAIKIFAEHQKTAWSNEKEIYNSMSMSNDNILKFFAADMDEGKKSESQSLFMPSNEYWLITEYHSKGSLHDFLKKDLLNWPQMVSLICCFFEGLAFLHSEKSSINNAAAFAHRDLKSKNILVKSDGYTCCIGDFGLALKLQNKNKLSSAEIRSKVGTKRYMSPELIEGAIAFTKETFLRIDVYASALVLWELLSRGDFYDETSDYKLPFADEVGSNPSLDEMKEIVVDKCQRPVIKQSWLINSQITTIAQTIEECWDIDLDARISAECAAARIRKIYKTTQ